MILFVTAVFIVVAILIPQEQQQKDRRLQSWSYATCRKYSSYYLRIHGCGPEYGLRRRQIGRKDSPNYHKDIQEQEQHQRILDNDDVVLETYTNIISENGDKIEKAF